MQVGRNPVPVSRWRILPFWPWPPESGGFRTNFGGNSRVELAVLFVANHFAAGVAPECELRSKGGRELIHAGSLKFVLRLVLDGEYLVTRHDLNRMPRAVRVRADVIADRMP